jgi:hypothetical protein
MLAVALALAFPASAASERTSGRGVLTVLAKTGIVYYRCGASHLQLGLRLWPYAVATTYVTFRAGRDVLRRELQPGAPTSWFPDRQDAVQSLATASGGEGGSVLGQVKARLANCGRYWPPNFSASERYTPR